MVGWDEIFSVIRLTFPLLEALSLCACEHCIILLRAKLTKS